MKKLKFIILLILVVSCSSFTEPMTQNNNQNDIKVVLDEKELDFITSPIIIDGTTYVPIRKIAESLDSTVAFEPNTKNTLIEKNNIVLSFNKDNNAIIRNDTMLVPIRYISESFGAEVLWNKDTRVITINSKTNIEPNSYVGNQKLIIDSDIILKNLKNITKSSRASGTQGEEDALNYINNKMIEYGYNTKIEEFPVYEKKKYNPQEITTSDSKLLHYSNNLIAEKSNSNAEKTILITAHYDCISNEIGVIDNGTGVATILEVARILQKTDLPINVKFVFFGSEEIGLIGSKYYVSNLTDSEIENFIGVINVDMVGEKNSGNLTFSTTSADDNILTLMFREMLNKEIPIDFVGASDEASFSLNKIPSITITDENSDYSLQTTEDEKNLNDYFDIKKLESTVDLISDFILKFTLEDYNRLLLNPPKIDFLSKKPYNADKIIWKSISIKDDIKIDGYMLMKNESYSQIIENGQSSEMNYVFKNNNNKSFIITEVFSNHLDENIFKNKNVRSESVFKNQNVKSDSMTNMYSFEKNNKACYLINNGVMCIIISSDSLSENELLEISNEVFDDTKI